MSVYRNIYGAYVISDIIDGYLVSRSYFGYTKRQAMALFKREAMS